MGELAEKIIKNLDHYGHKAVVAARSLRCHLFDVELDRPIFIVGCSRAGTTLVYRTFSEAQGLASLFRETHDFWASLHPLCERDWATHAIGVDEAGERDRQTVSQFFYRQVGASRIVDKNNQNGLSIPYLYRLFPDAHFVYVKRAPGDNINSLINGWGKADQFATWSQELPAEVAIDHGTYQRWCFFIPQGWRDYTQASIEAVCAFQYQMMNQAILDARATVPSAQWHEVSYEALIKQPVRQFEAVVEACGVRFDDRLRRHCAAVLDIPYNTFSEIRVDKWRDEPHRERIESVLPSVSDVARRMGY